MANEERTSGEREAINAAQARGGMARPVEGIDERTSELNPDSAPDDAAVSGGVGATAARGGSDQGGMAGPVGQFEGEGNEGAVAPLGGDVTKSAEDGATNSQGGVASGAPD